MLNKVLHKQIHKLEKIVLTASGFVDLRGSASISVITAENEKRPVSSLEIIKACARRNRWFKYKWRRIKIKLRGLRIIH
jgi:hypothetical protein